MKSSMLKYKWMCIAVLCCAMFTACETSPDELSYKNPISFGDRKNADDAVNALLWGHYGDTWIYGTENENGTEVFGQNANVTIVNEGTSTLTPQGVATRYWAQTDAKYNFYAMWPIEGSNHGITNVKYTNDTITFSCDITKQTDICIAATLNQTSQWNVLPANLQPVNLHFQHMLSKVQFIGSSASSAVEIVSASINVPTTASAVYSHNGTDLSIGYTLGAVSTLSTPEDFSMTIPESTAQTNTIDITNGGWLVFPGTTANITFKVWYETGVTDADGNPEIKDVYGTIPVTTVKSWERGKNYIYNFTIQPSGPIIFGGVGVTDWTSQPETEFDFPTEP